MAKNYQLPEPDDVSVDHLTKPSPQSHEFHFRLKTLLLGVTVLAVLLGGLRFLVMWKW